MSKVSEAKAAQGYTKKPAKCSTCIDYRSDITLYPGSEYKTEKKRHCAIGGFAVLASAICKLYERKP